MAFPSSASVLPCVIYAQDRSDDAGCIKDQQLEMDGCVQLLLPAAGCYLILIQERESWREIRDDAGSGAAACCLGERTKKVWKKWIVFGRREGERVTSSLTYAELQTSQVRARHWQWKANGSVAERKMISHTFLEIPVFIRISSYHSKLETSKK
jgi:hypothetical protein